MSGAIEAMGRHRMVAVIRHADAAAADGIARAAYAGGMRLLEVTTTVPGSESVIARLVADLPDAVVGAGTVLTPADAERAIAAGAAFLVSPGLRIDVLDVAAAAGVPAIPGAFTVTELLVARDAGAAVVKVFPAGVLGPGAMAAFRDVLPDVALVPTGGIDVADAPTWWDQGAFAVGVGSELARAWRQGPSEVQALAARGVALAAAAGRA